MADSLFLLAVLSFNVALSEWLVRNSFLRHFGTALVVIIVTAVVANLGLIPTYAETIPLYKGVFAFIGPLAIFWLVLLVRLKDVWRAGRTMLLLFIIGSLGTVGGVLAGMAVSNGSAVFGSDFRALGGMFVATYTGGSINFNALALHYGVVQDGALYAGAAAVDSLMTTVWMASTIAVPRVLGVLRRGASPETRDPHAAGQQAGLVDGIADDTETVHPVDLGWLLGIGALAVWVSEHLSEYMSEVTGENVPSILLVTTIALVLAQLGPVRRLRGTRVIGMFAVYIFLAVIGALCDVRALGTIGEIGPALLVFVLVTVTVHGLVIFGSASLLRLDPAMAAVASQANIGGGTTALALARSLGRPDLVLPAILVGSLGSALGTYLGFFTSMRLL